MVWFKELLPSEEICFDSDVYLLVRQPADSAAVPTQPCCPMQAGPWSLKPALSTDQ